MLLGLSWAVQLTFKAPDLPGRYEKEVILQFDGDHYPLRYHEVCSGECSDSSTLMIIPDIYLGVEGVLTLAESLEYSMKVVVPDLKSIQNSGFPDRLTVQGKQTVLEHFIDELQLQQIHLAGFGYGGLIATNIAVENEDIRSLSLLGSLGVQELRFLGNHSINHSLYSISRPFVALYKYAFPHFGWASLQKFDFDYVDAMRKLDQRDFRIRASALQLPVSVFHSPEDPNVPYATAVETHRIIPHSKLVTIGHHLTEGEKGVAAWSDRLIDFIENVEAEKAKTRPEASTQRLKRSELPFNPEDVESLHGRALIILIILIMTFTIFSEDLSVIAAGLLSAGGIIPFYIAVLSCFFGIIIVDVNIYWLGKAVGRPILKRAPFRWMIEERDLTRAQNLYEMYGLELLFIARFIPGARFPTYFSAGLLKLNFRKFFLYFTLSVLIWTPLLVGLTVLIGQPMIHYLSIYQDYALWILLFTILLIYLIVKVGIPLTTVRGRRRVLVKWARFLERWGAR